MTIEAQNVRSGPFTPNGVTKIFPFTFQVTDAAEVGVQINSVNVSKSLFTVTLNADGTGQVEFAVAPTGTTLSIVAEPEFTQEITLRNQGPFYQREVEKALDRRAMGILWLLDRLIANAPQQTILDLLAMNAGATRIGTSTGQTVQQAIDALLAAGVGSGAATSIGLFNNGAAAAIAPSTNFVFTSGKRVLGKGPAFYYEDNTFDAVNNPNAAFINNGRTFRIVREFASNMSLGASGDNQTTDGAAIQDLFDITPTGGTADLYQGPTGGADKITNASWIIDREISLRMRDQGVILRADTTVGGPFNTLRVNPMDSLNGGIYATIQGYFTGNSLVVTSNTAGKIIFAGSGLSAAGVAAGTHLKISPPADILSNATGTYAVQVNNADQTQNLGSAGAPLTIKVLFNNARNMLFEGGNFQSSGGYGLSFGDAANNATFAMIGTTIRNMNLTGTLGGLYVKGGLGREVQWMQVENCTVHSPVLSKISDGVIYRDCIITGTPIMDCLEGAFHDGMFSGALIPTNGMDIYAGSRMKWHNVQCEQSGVSTMTPHKAMLMFRGFNYPGIGNEVTGCNFGGGTGYDVHIAGYNQRGLLVEDCYLFHTGNPLGTGYHLYMDRDATDDASAALPYLATHNYNTSYKGRKDAYDWCIGYRLRFRGTVVTRQPIHEPTNNSRHLKVNYNGAMRMPHRGLWNPVSWHLEIAQVHTSLKTGSTLNTDALTGAEVFMEHSGAMKFQGGLQMAAGGITAIMTKVFRLPEYWRPFVNEAPTLIARKNDRTIADKVIPCYLEKGTGDVYVMDVPGATHDRLLFGGGFTWMAVTDPYSTEGP